MSGSSTRIEQQTLVLLDHPTIRSLQPNLQLKICGFRSFDSRYSRPQRHRAFIDVRYGENITDVSLSGAFKPDVPPDPADIDQGMCIHEKAHPLSRIGDHDVQGIHSCGIHRISNVELKCCLTTLVSTYRCAIHPHFYRVLHG